MKKPLNKLTVIGVLVLGYAVLNTIANSNVSPVANSSYNVGVVIGQALVYIVGFMFIYAGLKKDKKN